MVNRTNLTDRQIQVLKMRLVNISQNGIVVELGTTKSNISIIEGQTKANIERAKNTMEVVKMLQAPIWIEIDPNADIYEIPGIIFAEANKKNIWIPKGAPSVLAFMEKNIRDRLRERKVLEKIEIEITAKGDILIN